MHFVWCVFLNSPLLDGDLHSDCGSGREIDLGSKRIRILSPSSILILFCGVFHLGNDKNGVSLA